MSLAIDIFILILLLALVLIGMKRGFVKAVCSLLTTIIVLFGTIILTRTFAPSVAERISPSLEPKIEASIEPALQEKIEGISGKIEEITEKIREVDLPFGLNAFAADFIDQDTDTSSAKTVAKTFAQKAVTVIAYIITAIASYIILMIICAVITGLLNIVAKLPIVNVCNAALGAVIGFIQGSIYVLFIAYGVQTFNLLPQQIINESYLFKIIANLFA